MKRSPAQRSLEFLRRNGYICALVEKWNPHARCRQDLWGFADILAIRPVNDLRGRDILLVQTTSGGNTSARVNKVIANILIPTILRSGIRIEVHGWTKRKVKRGAPLYHYFLDRREVYFNGSKVDVRKIEGGGQ